MFLSISKGPYVLWQQLVPGDLKGDQLTSSYIAHFVLLCPNYTMKKLVCPAMPLILMNPMHHPVTMAKTHDFLPRGIEGKAKKLFFCTAISGICHFGPMHYEELTEGKVCATFEVFI